LATLEELAELGVNPGLEVLCNECPNPKTGADYSYHKVEDLVFGRYLFFRQVALYCEHSNEGNGTILLQRDY